MSRTLFLAVLLLLVLSPTAGAHEVDDPRVLVFTPRPAALEVRVSETWGNGDPAVEIRKRYDADRDGTLSIEEQERLKVFLRSSALANLTVRTSAKGKPLDLVLAASRASGIDGSVTSSAELRVEVAGSVPLTPDSGGVLRARVHDWRADGHDVRAAAVVPDEVLFVRAKRGTYNEERRTITGASLSRRSKPLVLIWRAAPSAKGAAATPDPKTAAGQ